VNIYLVLQVDVYSERKFEYDGSNSFYQVDTGLSIGTSSIDTRLSMNELTGQTNPYFPTHPKRIIKAR
jgi:hypothetical protein